MSFDLRSFTGLLVLSVLFCGCARGGEQYDVVIVGGGTSGTAAGIQAARSGARTLIVEQFDWLGGMLTSAGVSATDGNFKLRGGIWGEFRDSLENRYGGAQALKTGWVSNILFEPSVGDRIFKNIASAENDLAVWYRSTANGFRRENGTWRIDIEREGKRVRVEAKVLIDATELGDVAAATGVKYSVGMDSRHDTGENIAPGRANGIIQDLTYAMILKDYGRDMTIERPEGYDPSFFTCCCINELCVDPREPHRMWSPEMMLAYGRLPNDKYMINWPIEGNDYYLDLIGTPLSRREAKLQKAKDFSLGFLYFIQTELGMNTLGLADDEFPTDDLLPFIPYHRESRRTKGKVLFTLNHITDPYNQPQKLYRTAIGVGDYPVDHHHLRYPEWEQIPDLHFYPVPSYGLPMGVMIPQGIEGLIVAEKSISVTNLVNGSTRLQPVVLQIGQAAGIIAALAVQGGIEPSRVDVRDVQAQVLGAGGYLLPYLDLPADDPRFGAMQRIGATGIIKGEGANAGWENQTWFRIDSLVSVEELFEGARQMLGEVSLPDGLPELADTKTLARAFARIDSMETEDVLARMKERWESLRLENFDPARPLTRLECAVLIDHFVDPFTRWKVDITGELIE